MSTGKNGVYSLQGTTQMRSVFKKAVRVFRSLQTFLFSILPPFLPAPFPAPTKRSGGAGRTAARAPLTETVVFGPFARSLAQTLSPSPSYSYLSFPFFPPTSSSLPHPLSVSPSLIRNGTARPLHLVVFTLATPPPSCRLPLVPWTVSAASWCGGGGGEASVGR